jgi:hypothetical protein
MQRPYEEKGKQMMTYVQGKLDRLVEKLISRKFMVWLAATGLLAFSDLTSGDWVMISAIYIGGEAVIDGIARLKG